MIGKSRKKILENKEKEPLKKDTKISKIFKAPENSKTAINDDSFIIVNKEKKRERKKFSIKVFAFISFFVLLICTLFFGLKYVSFNITDMLWKTSLTRGSSDINNKSIRYQFFKNGLFRISNDGITYVDKKGSVAFAVSYNMIDPIYECANDYFAIADRNSFDFYIFDEKGLLGRNTSKYPIQSIALSESGILYILQSDENSSYIDLYRKDASPIDISIKNNFTGDGMPIDISVSQDGTELIVDYTCLSDSSIYSKATYYNFDEVGKNANSKRIVGEIIDDLSGKFLARVHFFDNENSCLVYDGGLLFVSTSTLTNPKITSKYELEEKIKSISYNDRFFTLITDDNKLMVFDKTGGVKVTKQLDFNYENYYLSDDFIVFLYENRTMIYDIRGRLIFDKELNADIQYVAKKKSIFFTELLLGLIDGVECIRFY